MEIDKEIEFNGSNQMVQKRTWEEFRESRLLQLTNTILHIFGWSIVLSIDEESGQVLGSYPARVKFRGFDTINNSEMYIKLSELMVKNGKTLLEEAKK